ncbi:MAG: hypothetical protein NTW21_07775 [Verrucomicrobia bacterium]|nr:hypothetical protein [Verrucomicrobiota bacterium]
MSSDNDSAGKTKAAGAWPVGGRRHTSVETIVGGHARCPLSLASYDVLLRTGNPLVKGEMPTARSWIADRG